MEEGFSHVEVEVEVEVEVDLNLNHGFSVYPPKRGHFDMRKVELLDYIHIRQVPNQVVLCLYESWLQMTGSGKVLGAIVVENQHIVGNVHSSCAS